MNHINTRILTLNGLCCCFNLRKITRAVTQFYDRHLEPAGIRATQFTLLIELANSKAKTLTQMADGLVMDRTTLTRNLRPLEKLGLITTTEVFDKRSKAYQLTQKGYDILNRGLPLWDKAQQHIMNVAGAERVQNVLRELDVIKNAAISPRAVKKSPKKIAV